jgi:hypothetical protein
MATIQVARPRAEALAGLGGVSLAGLTGLVITVAGLFIGLQPLRDNSFLTHLATGRLILDHGIPSSDPYTFTAHGQPWTVQSWLASVVYAGAEAVGGYVGIRVLIGVASAGLAYLLWRLTEPAGAVVVRGALLLPVVVIGAETWSERPMLFGLIGLAAVALLADGHSKPWLAVPLFWLWVNTHGSFPLGVVLLLTLVAGRRLDREPAHREVEVLKWSVVGLLVGAVNPIGPRLLVFPLELLQKTETLHFVKEWQPPDFSELAPKLLVLQAAVAVVLILRHRRFRSLLPMVVFLAAALVGARNVGPASIVLLAATAPALAGIGTDLGRRRSPLLGLVAVAVAGVATVAALGSLTGPNTDLVGYPTQAVAWLDDHGLTDHDARVVSRDFAGNYLEARYGTNVQVFMDDRYDMFPEDLVLDYETLRQGRDGWEEVVERWDADAILWDDEEGTDLVPLLEASPNWSIAYRDDRWVIALPTP